MKIRLTSSICTTVGRGAHMVALKPGKPVVCDAEHLDEILDAGNGHGRDLVKCGVIAIVELADPTPAVTEPGAASDSDATSVAVANAKAELSDEEIAKMTAAVAIPIIAGADEALLERWESIEKAGRARATVLAALDARLDELALEAREE